MNREAKVLMNIHRIEKAMSMPNRYPVFSQDIVKQLIIECSHDSEGIEFEILESLINTLGKYKKCLDTTINTNAQIVDKVNEFFKVNSRIESITMEFDKTINSVNHKRDESFKVLEEIANQRHSVRNFTTQTVGYESIDKAVKIANSLPTPCNRQSCSLMIIDNIEIRNEILALQQGNKGFSAPILAAIVVDLTAFTQENEHYAPYYHAGSFTAGLVLGLESLNISSCLLNWHVKNESNKKVKELLELDKKEITAFIFIGYAQEGKSEAYSFKKNSLTLVEIIK